MASLTLIAALSLAATTFATIQRGYECTKTPNDCAPGLVCAGFDYKKTCVVPKHPGMQCRIEPFWVCRSELVCENDVCKIPAGGECRAQNSVHCAKGLVCEDHTCKIPRGGVCTKTPNQCVDGLSCDGKGDVKKCITYKGPGMRCPKRENFWICAKGLTCENDVCKIPRGKVCTDNQKDCVKGTACDGKADVKRCIMYKAPGMRCPRRENFWICRPGLTCNKHDVCKIPVGGSCAKAPKQCVADATCDRGVCKIKRGRRCERKPKMCVRGSQCVGFRKKKLCMPLRGVGHKCSTIGFFRCAPGLTCHYRRCRRGVVPFRGSCKHVSKACKPGLVCAGPLRRRICVKPMGKGKRCNTDPYWKCADGLYCNKSKTCIEL